MTLPIGTYNYSMGLYDRDYGRSHEPGLHLSAPQTMTMKLVLITGAIYLAAIVHRTVRLCGSLSSLWSPTGFGNLGSSTNY